MKSMILNEGEYSLVMQMHHKRRYEFASLFVNIDDSVLDIGCGTGYGCNIMNQRSKYVEGIDLEMDSLEYAIEHYPNCKFTKTDIRNLSIKPQYDIITCFHVLEHLSLEDGIVFLDTISKKTRQICFINVPTDSKLGINVNHLSEWMADEIKDVTSQYFKRNIMLSQDWASGLIHYPFSEQHSFIMMVCIK